MASSHLILSSCLLQAWALFKGKYREGLDKPDPPTWKTRLRCALNKSNDFDELVERSQLDISDPYKVYRIIPEGAKRGNFHTWMLGFLLFQEQKVFYYQFIGCLLMHYLVIGSRLFKGCSFWSWFDALKLTSSF